MANSNFFSEKELEVYNLKQPNGKELARGRKFFDKFFNGKTGGLGNFKNFYQLYGETVQELDLEKLQTENEFYSEVKKQEKVIWNRKKKQYINRINELDMDIFALHHDNNPTKVIGTQQADTTYLLTENESLALMLGLSSLSEKGNDENVMFGCCEKKLYELILFKLFRPGNFNEEQRKERIKELMIESISEKARF